jgi:hypothetical protein
MRPFGPMDLKPINNLRHLLLGITSERGDPNCSDQLSWLTRALVDDSLPNTLEEVTIVVVSTLFGVVSRASRPRVRQIYLSLRNFGLDAILGANSKRFPKLRKVTITVDPSNKMEETKELKDFLWNIFPLLVSKGILHAEFCDVHDIFTKMSVIIPN